MKLKSNTYKNNRNNASNSRHLTTLCVLFLFFFLPFIAQAQVTSSVDSTTVKIGEQITYKIQVEADTTDVVVFPEGQTFLPLEVIESYPIDTSKKDAKYELIKSYALTQFDSGTFSIPRQKIAIGSKFFFTDSLNVQINDVEVDTTKQKLYDIKPIIEVDKSSGHWFKYLLMVLLIVGAIAFLMYWFIWRDKPLTTEEKIALLPPYERAKLALKELDEAQLLDNDELKAYYSQLTLIIRKYLDEKVYDHSLESTTDELISRLRLLKDGNQIDLDQNTIKNIETIFRRADLVKFAKSRPDKELAKLDRKTIDLEIDHVKESLPEPTEEELLADLKFQEELARKKKRRRIIITAVVSVLLIIGTITGFILHYGYDYVKDTVLGHPTKELLESKEWVTSEYGAPGITITTPKVLQRMPFELPEELKETVQMVMFGYGSFIDQFYVVTSTAKYNQESLGEDGVDLQKVIEGNFSTWEAQGAQNLITRNEQFITPNGADGLKIHGTGDFPGATSDEIVKGKYVLLLFNAENVVQQIVLKWAADDVYADEIVERILSSIELVKLSEEESEEEN